MSYGDLLGDELKFGGDGSIEVCDVPLSKRPMARLRLKALRGGVWFSKLKESQRKLMGLVIRVVERVRSLLLAKVLVPIIRVLIDAMRNCKGLMEAVIGPVAYWMKKKARSLAQHLSLIAQGWGSRSAAGWGDDERFIRYLTIINLPKNKPP